MTTRRRNLHITSELLDCPICYKTVRLRLPSCQHRICGVCVEKIKKQDKEGRFQCPECRQYLAEPDGGFPVCRLTSYLRGLSNKKTHESDTCSPTTGIRCHSCTKDVEMRCSSCDKFLCYSIGFGDCRCCRDKTCQKGGKHQGMDVVELANLSKTVFEGWKDNMRKEIQALVAATQEKVSILEFVSERYPQEEDPVEKIILVEQLTAGQIKIDAGHDESAVSEATVSSPTVKTLPVTGVSDNKDGACSKVYDTFNSKVIKKTHTQNIPNVLKDDKQDQYADNMLPTETKSSALRRVQTLPSIAKRPIRPVVKRAPTDRSSQVRRLQLETIKLAHRAVFDKVITSEKCCLCQPLNGEDFLIAIHRGLRMISGEPALSDHVTTLTSLCVSSKNLAGVSVAKTVTIFSEDLLVQSEFTPSSAVLDLAITSTHVYAVHANTSGLIKYNITEHDLEGSLISDASMDQPMNVRAFQDEIIVVRDVSDSLFLFNNDSLSWTKEMPGCGPITIDYANECIVVPLKIDPNGESVFNRLAVLSMRGIQLMKIAIEGDPIIRVTDLGVYGASVYFCVTDQHEENHQLIKYKLRQ